MLSILLVLLLHTADSLGEAIRHLLWEVTTNIHYIRVKNKLNVLKIVFSPCFFQLHNLDTQIMCTNLALQVQNQLIIYLLIKPKRR